MNGRGMHVGGTPKTSKAMAAVIRAVAKARGLDLTKVGVHTRVENEPYMALVIEVIGPHLISVAHYGEQNGDPMCDPEMIFSTATTDGSFLPVSYRNDYVGSFRQCTTVDAAGQPVGFMPGEVRDQVSFANTWARNLKEQGFIAAAKRPAPGE
jgi:hypothetical protein